MKEKTLSSFPQYFLIQTTSFCNAKCLICPYEKTVGQQKQGLMKDNIFEKVIDEIFENKDSVKQVMPYLMNEPLMDRTIIEKIYSIHHKCSEINIHLVTNGILLNESLGNKLIESPLNSLKISVLGHWKQTYESVMGVSGFERIFARLTSFVKKAVAIRGKEWVSISCTRTPNYLFNEEVVEGKSFWNWLGVKYEFFDQPISRAGNVGCFNAPHHQRIKGCNSVWRDKMIHILFNGDVVLCCLKEKKHKRSFKDNAF